MGTTGTRCRLGSPSETFRRTGAAQFVARVPTSSGLRTRWWQASRRTKPTAWAPTAGPRPEAHHYLRYHCTLHLYIPVRLPPRLVPQGAVAGADVRRSHAHPHSISIIEPVQVR